MSYWGAVDGNCWQYMPNFRHTELADNFTEVQLFGTGYRLRCVPCPAIRLRQNVRWFIPTIRENSAPSPSVSPRSDSTLKDSKSVVPNGTFFQCFLLVFATYNPFSFGCRFRWSSGKVGLCSAIGSNVANVSVTRTFLVGSSLPSIFGLAFDRMVPRLGQNILAVSDFHTVQCLSFVAAGFFVQVSHHHWIRTTSATVNDCHDVCLHLCMLWKCCCAVNSLKI